MKIPATHQRRITGHGKEAAAWVSEQLGIEPRLVNRVVITLDVGDVVTADVRMFVTDEMLAALDTDLAAQPAFTDGIVTCLHCDEKVAIDKIKAHLAAKHTFVPPLA